MEKAHSGREPAANLCGSKALDGQVAGVPAGKTNISSRPSAAATANAMSDLRTVALRSATSAFERASGNADYGLAFFDAACHHGVGADSRM